MVLKLVVHGAARGVTGSCFALETDNARVLVDCGMFQGSKTERDLNGRDFPFSPGNLDAVLLTHAHIDHSGLLPKLVRDGYSGAIHATQATIDLCSVMLPDAAHIQEQEAERRTKREKRRHRAPEIPAYTVEDALDCLTRFQAVSYLDWVTVAEGIRARFWNAGHLLGSASIEVEVSDAGKVFKMLFSGDVGAGGKLFQQTSEAPSGLDFVVCEGTYGAQDRPERGGDQRRQQLEAEVQAAVKRGGALLIPSFAVERTQEVLSDLAFLMESGKIPIFPIIIDSPLAARATAVFKKHVSELVDGAAFIRALDSPHVSFTETIDQSKALDQQRGFHAVIAGSGMCDAGRIKHRLKNWLWRSDATVLMVGFQATGTLGRVLLDGAKSVRIHGEEIAVSAAIRCLDIYSGHADAPELQHWLMQRRPISGAVFLVHGEDQALTALRDSIEPGIAPTPVIIPELDQGFELHTEGARPLRGEMKPRLVHDMIGHFDSGNDEANLLLDISDRLAHAADERGRRALLRRLRRALEDENAPPR